MITVYLIRHAESQGNVNHHIVGGQSNHLPLTDRGRNQAQLLGARLAQENLSFDHVYSSTAIRARHTAKIALEALQAPVSEIQYTPAILEVSQGEWEGQLRKDIYHADRQADMRANPLDFKAPGGESIREVQTRMWNWLQQTAQAFPRDQETQVAAFSHGFSIRCLLMYVLSADPLTARRTMTHNTSINVLQYDGNQWLIERINDAAHLSGTEMIAHY